ncbi:MAG: DeoR/GlpR family DNA-binding transcription regulator [Rhizobium sp.]|nr:DeoR/GlpR family DNA-binding transcription regulator [Rhizobium sp.]
MDSTPDERRSFILQRLAELGRLSTHELSAHFQISEHTARRDFRELAAGGLIKRVHGAALPVGPAHQEFHARYKISVEEKVRLAKAAGSRVSENQVILVDGGTTNVEIVRHLPIDLSATIVTNSITVAEATRHHRNLRVVLLGGTVDQHSQMTLGARVLEQVRRVNADICFLGIHGLDATHGLTTGSVDEAAVKEAMICSSAEVIAAATSDKLGTVAAFKFAEMTDVDTYVIEQKSTGHPVFEGLLDASLLGI